MQALGVPILVAHRARMSESDVETIKSDREIVDEAHAACKGFKVKIALEITAGQGSNLGNTFEQMAQIFDAVVDHERLRLCFDTEHAFAAGYDIRTRRDVEKYIRRARQICWAEATRNVHLNDSIKDFNSHVDRHQHDWQELHRTRCVSAFAQRRAIFRASDVS